MDRAASTGGKSFHILSTNSRRGVTPTKTPAPKPQPKPKLSHEQILKALERIQNRDFVQGAGIAQFYEPVNSTNKKNLLEEFSKVQDNPNTGTAFVTDKMEAGEPLFSSTKLVGATAVEEDEGTARHQWRHEPLENYQSFPWYLKSMDKLIVLYDNCMRDLIDIAEKKSDRDFHKMFPQKGIVTTISQLDKISVLMERFEKSSALSKLQLFETQSETTVCKKGKPAKGTGSIRCDIKEREKFVASMYKLKNLMPRISNVLANLEGLDVETQLSDKLECLKDMVDTRRKRLELLDSLQMENKKVIEEAEDIEREMEGGSSGSSSSSSSSNDDSPFSSPE